MSHTPMHERCPFLGLHDDPKTALAYPSPWNCCYRAVPHAPVSVPQQMSNCLNRSHAECPVLLAESRLELPRELRGTPIPIQQKATPNMRWLRILFFIAFMGAAVFLGYSIFVQPVSPFLISTPSPLPQHTDESRSPVPSILPLDIPAQEDNSLPTGESEVVCGHSLDVPFGSDPPLVVHRVKSGENINGYADDYGTTVQAILSINHEMRIPIWENTLVVIPIGTTLVVGLPTFEIFEIPKTVTSPADLIQTLDTDLPSFLKYNAFDESCTIFSGWILVPRGERDP